MPSSSVAELEHRAKQRPLPKHLGIIMDGNGRWAEARGRPRLEGHREGSNSVREITRSCRRLGLDALTLYAFSAQNWSRPSEEVAGLMQLLREYLEREREEILGNGIRLNAIGDLDRLPPFVREPLDELRDASSKNRDMVLTLALSYGGREELVHAAQQLARRVAAGELKPDDITESLMAGELWTRDLPPVDLVVRTSGEMRVSNFLLWQAAYAEFVFTETLWPDFRVPALVECLGRFQERERRFGLTSAQLRAAGT